jgi:hypothetical protein
MKNLLLLDDSVNIQKVVRLTLGQSTEWNLKVIPQPSELYAALQQYKPDVILCSIHYFKQDLSVALNLEHKYAPLILLIETQHSAAELQQKGFVNILCKPFATQDLINIIKNPLRSTLPPPVPVAPAMPPPIPQVDLQSVPPLPINMGTPSPAPFVNPSPMSAIEIDFSVPPIPQQEAAIPPLPIQPPQVAQSIPFEVPPIPSVSFEVPPIPQAQVNQAPSIPPLPNNVSPLNPPVQSAPLPDFSLDSLFEPKSISSMPDITGTKDISAAPELTLDLNFEDPWKQPAPAQSVPVSSFNAPQNNGPVGIAVPPPFSAEIKPIQSPAQGSGISKNEILEIVDDALFKALERAVPAKIQQKIQEEWENIIINVCDKIREPLEKKLEEEIILKIQEDLRVKIQASLQEKTLSELQKYTKEQFPYLARKVIEEEIQKLMTEAA